MMMMMTTPPNDVGLVPADVHVNEGQATPAWIVQRTMMYLAMTQGNRADVHAFVVLLSQYELSLQVYWRPDGTMPDAEQHLFVPCKRMCSNGGKPKMLLFVLLVRREDKVRVCWLGYLTDSSPELLFATRLDAGSFPPDGTSSAFFEDHVSVRIGDLVRSTARMCNLVSSARTWSSSPSDTAPTSPTVQKTDIAMHTDRGSSSPAPAELCENEITVTATPTLCDNIVCLADTNPSSPVMAATFMPSEFRAAFFAHMDALSAIALAEGRCQNGTVLDSTRTPAPLVANPPKYSSQQRSKQQHYARGALGTAVQYAVWLVGALCPAGPRDLLHRCEVQSWMQYYDASDVHMWRMRLMQSHNIQQQDMLGDGGPRACWKRHVESKILQGIQHAAQKLEVVRVGGEHDASTDDSVHKDDNETSGTNTSLEEQEAPMAPVISRALDSARVQLHECLFEMLALVVEHWISVYCSCRDEHNTTCG